MYNAVREPTHDVEEPVCVGREDVAQIGTVENVFQRRQYSDPYWRSPIAGYEPMDVHGQ